MDPGATVPVTSPSACVQPPHGHALGRPSQLPGFVFVDVILRSLSQNTLGSFFSDSMFLLPLYFLLLHLGLNSLLKYMSY